MSNNPRFRRRSRRNTTAVNKSITAQKVRVVLEDGRQLGVMPTEEALSKAKQLGLDLVEMIPNASPPICKLIDYGKFKYEASKKKKPISTQVKIKEIKFRVATDTHDYQVKISRIKEFLQTGNKVRVRLQFRGRENIHRKLGFDFLDKVIADLADIARIDQAPKLSGTSLIMVFSLLSGKSSKNV